MDIEATLAAVLEPVGAFIWGPVMLVLLLGTGLYLTIGLRALPWRKLGYGFRLMWRGTSADEGSAGDITPFNALMTALAATVGTGNIAGVATAIYLGGPGAVFWMWVTALLGMATKYGEAVLAVRYREVDERGEHVGGPMYYIRNGLGRNWRWLAFLFALFGTVAAFGIGNTIQSNSVADAVRTSLGISPWITGLALATMTGLVIIGGVRWIGQVAGRLVPFMAAVYVVGAAIIIAMHIEALPGAIALIVSDAFTGTAATGGFAGASVMMAIRFGVARGVFSNEAGLGTAPIAHAAARTRDPVRQGTIAMLGTFIDTIVICSMTALVIIMTGLWSSGANGAALSTLAFGHGFPGLGEFVVTFGLIVFAFSTTLGWALYGERCAEYIFGVGVIKAYRVLWVVAILGGALLTEELNLLWLIADVMNGFMAIPNLIALLLLSPVVFAMTKGYFGRGGNGTKSE